MWLTQRQTSPKEYSKGGAPSSNDNCDNERVDGYAVVLVLLVGVRAAQAQAGQEGPEEVSDEADDNECRCAP